MFVALDREASLSLTRQVYGQLRSLILQGTLAAGAKLPSSRALAKELGVSRNVTLEAYDLLYAEGFTGSLHGSGTYVAEGAAYGPAASAEIPRIRVPGSSRRQESKVIDFRSGMPDLSRFPAGLWSSLLREVYSSCSADVLGYGRPEGRAELREAICDDIVSRRGVRCRADQILITMGTTQATALAARLLAVDRREVVSEDPVTEGLQLILRACGVVLAPVPVDDAGMRTDQLPDLRPAFVYVTPSHQFPIGGTLPMRRRVELLRYAERTGAYVFEDDYDSEFRFEGPPLSALHGLDPERVLYAGTFSKTLCPAIRMGYLILPPVLVERARALKWQIDLHNETPTQLALARFIRGGHYLRHIARMRKLYRKRRDVLSEALGEAFGDRVRALGHSTGLHLSAQWRDVVFSPELLERVERAGARFHSAAAHAIASPENYRDTLVLGYGSLQEAELQRGVAILHSVIGEAQLPRVVLRSPKSLGKASFGEKNDIN